MGELTLQRLSEEWRAQIDQNKAEFDISAKQLQEYEFKLHS